MLLATSKTLPILYKRLKLTSITHCLHDVLLFTCIDDADGKHVTLPHRYAAGCAHEKMPAFVGKN